MAIKQSTRLETPDDAMNAALGKMSAARSRKAPQRKANNGAQWKPVALGVVVVVGLLLLDLYRREGAEYRALVASTSGQVWMQPAGKQATVYVAKGASLSKDDTIVTGANSNAVLAFPEGSTLVLEPNTTFKVRVMDYDRNGKRDRSFMVSAGKVWSSVAEGYGANRSQMDICTPTAVAAVRGTVYSVGYDARSRATSVGVQRGKVGFATPTARYDGASALEAGRSATAAGYRLGNHQQMTAEQLQDAIHYEKLLAESKTKPSGIEAFEKKVADVAYVPLGWIGVGPKSWITRSFDTSIRQRTVQAMKQLHFHIVSTQNEGQAEFPEFVNPVTLEELRIAERDRDQIMLSFAGGRIELYQQYGRGYRLTVFSKDTQRTAYEVNDRGKIERVDPIKARTLLEYTGITGSY